MVRHDGAGRKREGGSRDVTSQQLITITSGPAGLRDGISVVLGESWMLRGGVRWEYRMELKDGSA